MKRNWQKFLVWSSIGSVAALGATLVVAKRNERTVRQLGSRRKIPRASQRIFIWTEQSFVQQEGRQSLVRDKYVLQITPFQVWNILDLSSEAEGSQGEGATVYHVTHVRLIDSGGGHASEEERVLDRFYATVSVIDGTGKSCGKNHLARGGILELYKCRVGGAKNGVETGDVHRSATPVLNYRFEYTPL